MNVSLMREDSHIFCIACSNGNMRGDMATTAIYLLSIEEGHEYDDEIHPLFIFWHVFDFVFLVHSSIYCLVVEVIFLYSTCHAIFYSYSG